MSCRCIVGDATESLVGPRADAFSLNWPGLHRGAVTSSLQRRRKEMLMIMFALFWYLFVALLGPPEVSYFYYSASHPMLYAR